MYTIENVIREINGEKKMIKFIAGSGNLTNTLKSKTVTLKSGDNIELISGFGESIAFNYHDDGREKVKYFPLEVWGKNAEVLDKYSKKGMELSIIGRLEPRKFRTKKGKFYEDEILVVELFQITSRSKK